MICRPKSPLKGGVRMADIFPSVHGNKTVKDLLGSDIFAEKNAHAYIIAGPVGSGKHTIARAAAAALGCTADKNTAAQFPCGRCIHCTKVARNVAPDVIYINRGDKATLGVEIIRDLKSGLYIAPNEAPFKVYIIEEADKMTVQAQNAFLLSLEEPPAFALFFLLVETPENLLETVRSRAPVLRTEQFPPDEVIAYIRSQDSFRCMSADKEKRLTEAAAISDGTIGQTLMFMAESDESFSEAVLPRKTAEMIFESLCRSPGRESIGILTDMPKSRADCVNLLMLVRLAVRDGCAVKKSAGAKTVFFPSPDDARAIVKNVSFTKLYRIGEAVNEAIAAIEQNASSQAVLTSLILKKYS